MKHSNPITSDTEVKTNYYEENSKMAENGFSSSDAVLWGAMNNMGRGYGGYGGAWGSGYGGYGGGYAPFAGPGSNAVRINRNNDLTREMNRATQFTLDQAEESRRFTDITNNMFRSELRNGDRIRDIEREMNANARAAADCCCETQKEILKLNANNNLKFSELSKQQAVDNGATQAKLAAIEAKIDANKEIFELRAQLQTQQIFATCGCGCGGGVRPCPPPQ